ncbi:putative heterokaryon incompatibility protein [Rosellinia necatrix]|uniref:Putative heterokaryon incompatibility protein n=1 Tax=Rosellinia necatrix TaxID=77044 RepID=A0A1W2TG07_ROSNE|nr:putative heterokaryon incompatibility protein [Rosellinia necatrix]
MFEIKYDRIDDIPGGGDHIRILTLAGSQSFTDPIHVRLSVVELASRPPPVYEALSYCWGDAADRRLVFCDGAPFPVTRNLETALRHLRRCGEGKGEDGGDRVLWVDAICINQNDLAERAHQVGLMRQIYETASRVVIWLGEAKDDSHLVLPLCKRLFNTWQDLLLDDFDLADPTILFRPDVGAIWRTKLREVKHNKAIMARSQGGGMANDDSHQPDGTEARREDDEAEEAMLLEDPTKEDVAAMLLLISRPWFTRCWVFQEAVLGRSPLVLCGESALEWDMFYAGVILITALSAGGLTGRHAASNMTPVMMMRNKRRASMANRAAEAQRIDLLWLLWQVRELDATDPRDKVYSVLGLVGPDEARAGRLVPDYTVSVGECYRRAALAIMSYTRNLDVFLIEQNPGSRPGSSLSWVPDWVCSKSPTPVSYIRADDRGNPKGSRYKAFRASTADEWDVAGKVNGDVLKLSGYVLDVIVALEDILTVPHMNQVNINGMYASTGAFTGFWKGLLGGLGTYFEGLVRWEKLALSRKYPKYPTGEDPETVFAMTLCAGNIDGPETALAGFREWRKILRGPKSVGFLGRFAANSQAYKSLVGITGLVPNIRAGAQNRVYLTATERSLYRRLARTEKGYLAMVPSQSAIGDRISVFQGGKMPFVIRAAPYKNGYQLIGPSYVHGIMYGEAWDDTLVRDIAIV